MTSNRILNWRSSFNIVVRLWWGYLDLGKPWGDYWLIVSGGNHLTEWMGLRGKCPQRRVSFWNLLFSTTRHLIGLGVQTGRCLLWRLSWWGYNMRNIWRLVVDSSINYACSWAGQSGQNLSHKFYLLPSMVNNTDGKIMDPVYHY